MWLSHTGSCLVMLTCQRGTLGTVPTFLLLSPWPVSWQWLPSCLQPLAWPQTAQGSSQLTDQLVDKWTGRQLIHRYGQRWTHGQPNTWTEMDRKIMHLQFPVVEFPPCVCIWRGKGEWRKCTEQVSSQLDRLSGRQMDRQTIDRQIWTEMDTWTIKHMDNQTHGQRWMVKNIDKDGQIDNAPSIPKFPPRGVVLPEVTMATDACWLQLCHKLLTPSHQIATTFGWHGGSNATWYHNHLN